MIFKFLGKSLSLIVNFSPSKSSKTILIKSKLERIFEVVLNKAVGFKSRTLNLNNLNPIQKIALDTESGNNLFILFGTSSKNNLYILKNFDTLPILVSVQLPEYEEYFIDFDAKYGKLVGIGNKTNLIYQTDINKNKHDRRVSLRNR